MLYAEDIDRYLLVIYSYGLTLMRAALIVRINHNHFVLIPLSPYLVTCKTAAIKGKVLQNADAVVSAISNGDTLVAFPNGDGRFKIKGLRGTTTDIY